jgi:ubiquinone/menaquinone biosynthesis C-methylase UbiE
MAMKPMDGSMRSWLSYWSAPNKSYVNERHREAHYAVVFAGVRPHLPQGPGRTALDWGCADAYAAREIAEICGAVVLYDAADATRQRLHTRFGGDPRIRVIDAGLGEVEADSIDIVIVNSVIQYLSAAEFGAALRQIHRVLKPEGALLIGDVIDPKTRTSRHVATFLAFAARNGFLAPAVLGLARTSMSSYSSLQREIGLATYTPAEIERKLAECGFVAERLTRNIAVSPYRSSFIARKLDRAKRAPML